MPAPTLTDVVLLEDGRPVGRLTLKDGRLLVEAADPALARSLAELAAQPLSWLADDGAPGVEATVRRTADPGTAEHLRVLMFEVRRLGLEARLQGA